MVVKKYAVLLALLALVVAVVAYGVAADSKGAALFLNGVMANLFDPFIWLVALPFATIIRKNMILLPTLFIVACLVCILKLYLRYKTGSGWITGSIAGNLVGLMTVGYIINAVAVFIRGRRQPATGQGA
ncbi:hypothetical protein [Lysobacter solisilvae (ex Woo and Kim 2020)]|uniref:Uncharacterized protein n=1 Tax=Agrilutibacter terrestris TaxID=2865112 RepID=A0A7H0FVZ8_9GAMM|nr:hypothetical protein [Lysobacter terrestris]QNP40214.1 hypothetical protein H8B22_12055 [Lysobacter terrestris]